MDDAPDHETLHKMVRDVVSTHDLNELTTKIVRKKLEEQLGRNLKAFKKVGCSRARGLQ